MKICSKCHAEKPLTDFYKNKNYKGGYTTWCKICHRGFTKQWSKENADNIKEWAKKYYQENKERINERINARCRERWASDPVYRDRKNRQKKEYNLKNPELKKAKDRASKAASGRIKNKVAENMFSHSEWVDLCNSYNNRCASCGCDEKLTVDHIIPLSRGGINTIDNIQPLCKKCNERKGSKIT